MYYMLSLKTRKRRLMLSFFFFLENIIEIEMKLMNEMQKQLKLNGMLQ